MARIKDLLATYNLLATELGHKPLKSWKAAKAQLEHRIAELQTVIDKRIADAEAGDPLVEQLRATVEAADDATSDETKKRIELIKERAKSLTVDMPKKKSSKKASKKTKEKVNGAELVSVADIAREVGMNPKVARAKLRRRGMGSEGGRWMQYVPGSEGHVKVRDILTGADKS